MGAPKEIKVELKEKPVVEYTVKIKKVLSCEFVIRAFSIESAITDAKKEAVKKGPAMWKDEGMFVVNVGEK